MIVAGPFAPAKCIWILSSANADWQGSKQQNKAQNTPMGLAGQEDRTIT
jgi:hypothetical protein